MAAVGVTDLAFRDAHQSLFATRMLTSDMASVAGLMDEAGFWSLETWGGATFDACIRFLNEDPWERLDRLRSAMPKTPMQMLLRGQNLLGYRHYADDVVEEFVKCAAGHGVSVFRVFDALNDTRNLATSLKAVRKAGKHAQAALSYAVTPVHTIETYVALAKEMKAMGADSICIKDMSGLLKPYDADALVRALSSGAGLPVQVHTHATTGMSVATLLKSVEAGAARVDTAISALAMGTSHSPTETVVEMLRGTEYDTRLDLKLLARAAAELRVIRRKYRDFESSFVGADTRILTSQVPGGMLSNLESQLKEQGKLDRMDAVLEEIAAVQKDFGYPPLVTPTSQIVGTQAVFNVLFGRYERLTAESRDLLVGRYGRTPASPDAGLLSKALAEAKIGKPVMHRPADDLPPEMARVEAELKEKLGAGRVGVKDVLTYAMFPQLSVQFFGKRSAGPVTISPRESESRPAASGRYTVRVDGRDHAVRRKTGGEGQWELEVDGVSRKVTVKDAPAGDAKAGAADHAGEGTPVLAPMPGDVIRLACEDGGRVEEGQTLVIMEAMKLQMEVKSRHAGFVKYRVAPGQSVKADQVLATVK